ncbi:hypothetical protein [Arthrobacter sp. FW306-07-I]|nr:hypothetical protein [Arthrobacter sp. FW306-07-I]UKA76462.1 hypothetical protein LFT46_05230 [Arthrobacter sp. FW306-07-I]
MSRGINEPGGFIDLFAASFSGSLSTNWPCNFTLEAFPADWFSRQA